MKEFKARHARPFASRLLTIMRSGCTRRFACHAVLASVTALASVVPVHADEAPAKSTAPDNSGAGTLEEIVVTGYLYSLEASEKAKKHSAEVIEVISPEDLGKFTDSSMADALQRVPGVQIDRDTDGRSGAHVAIDGIGAEFVTTTVNGRTPGGYGHEGLYEMRQYPLDAFPTEILSGTVIYKTASAELVESGLGGEIDFQTLKPLEYKPKSGENYFGSLTIKGQNNSNGSSTDLNYSNDVGGKGVSGIVGEQLLDHTLGFYMAGTISTNRYTEDAMEVRPQYETVNVENSAGAVNQENVLFPSLPLYQNIRRQEDRRAVSTGLQWDPIDSIDVNLDYSYSLYNRKENRDVIGINENSAGTFLPGGISIQDGSVTSLNYENYIPAPGTTGSGVSTFYYPLIYDHSATTQIGGLNAKWQGERLSFATDLSLNSTGFWENLADAYIPALADTPSASTTYSEIAGAPSSFSAGMPPLTSSLQIGGPYYLGEKFIHTTNDGGALKLDGAYKFSGDTKLKLGFRYAETEVDARVYNFNGNALTAGQQQIAENLIFPGGVDNIFPGYNLGGSNAQPHQDFAGYLANNAQLGYIPATNLNQPPFTGPFAGAGATYGSYAPDLTQNHTNQEKTLAEYGQVDTKGSLFGTEYSGNAGLRVVHTEEIAQGFQGVSYVNIDNNPTRTLPPTLIVSHDNYTTFLPSANVTFFPWQDIDFRFGIGRTISRPEYIDMSPIASIFVPDPTLPGTAGQKGLVTTGNPLLKPETAWNYNWTVDYYAPRGGSFVASAFYKRVSDFIAPITINNAPLANYPGQLFTLTTPENVSGGTAYGAEVGFNLPLKNYLPALNGFGVQANYTYVESVINATDLDPSHPGTSPFPGASKNNVNGTVYFSKDPWEFRVAVLYRSDYLSSFPVLPQTAVPIYTEGSTLLDMSVNYVIVKNLTVTFTGTNLTGADRRDYAYSRTSVLNYYTQPRILALALRGSF